VSQFFNLTIAFVCGKNLFPKLEFVVKYVLVQISSHTFFLWKVCERISGRHKFLCVSSVGNKMQIGSSHEHHARNCNYLISPLQITTHTAYKGSMVDSQQMGLCDSFRNQTAQPSQSVLQRIRMPLHREGLPIFDSASSEGLRQL
jgi:hypothetical protein